jgi:hypothetical protein
MKRFLIGGISLVLIVFAAMNLCAAPQLRVSDSTFAFGIVPQHATISHIFWLYSVGDDTIKISKVVPGCSCMRAPIEKNILPPKDSVRLILTLDTRMYRGQIYKHPAIYTNAPDSVSNILFTAFATTRPDTVKPIQIIPYKLEMIQYGDNPRNRIDFTLKNASEKDLTPKLVSFPVDFVTIELPSVVPANGEAKGSVIINADVTDKPFQRSFTFQVNDDKSTRYTVPIIRHFRGESDETASTK